MAPALLEILALIVIRTAPWVPYHRLYSSKHFPTVTPLFLTDAAGP